jgi:hypothetical protein
MDGKTSEVFLEWPLVSYKKLLKFSHAWENIENFSEDALMLSELSRDISCMGEGLNFIKGCCDQGKNKLGGQRMTILISRQLNLRYMMCWTGHYSVHSHAFQCAVPASL